MEGEPTLSGALNIKRVLDAAVQLRRKYVGIIFIQSSHSHIGRDIHTHVTQLDPCGRSVYGEEEFKDRRRVVCMKKCKRFSALGKNPGREQLRELVAARV